MKKSDLFIGQKVKFKNKEDWGRFNTGIVAQINADGWHKIRTGDGVGQKYQLHRIHSKSIRSEFVDADGNSDNLVPKPKRRGKAQRELSEKLVAEVQGVERKEALRSEYVSAQKVELRKWLDAAIIRMEGLGIHARPSSFYMSGGGTSDEAKARKKELRDSVIENLDMIPELCVGQNMHPVPSIEIRGDVFQKLVWPLIEEQMREQYFGALTRTDNED